MSPFLKVKVLKLSKSIKGLKRTLKGVYENRNFLMKKKPILENRDVLIKNVYKRKLTE